MLNATTLPYHRSIRVVTLPSSQLRSLSEIIEPSITIFSDKDKDDITISLYNMAEQLRLEVGC